MSNSLPFSSGDRAFSSSSLKTRFVEAMMAVNPLSLANR